MEVLFLYYNSFENSFRVFYFLLILVRFTFFLSMSVLYIHWSDKPINFNELLPRFIMIN